MGRSELSADDYRRFYETTTVPTITLDLNARAILEVNEAAVDFLGMPREQIVGRPGADFLTEPTEDEVLRVRALRGQSTRTLRNVTTSRGIRTTEINMVPTGSDGLAFVQAVDLTDLLDANRALEMRTTELQSKTAALETVAARMAHDLRSPLATIAGFVDLLATRGERLPAERRADMLDRVSNNVRTLAAMVNEVLEQAANPDQILSSASSVAELDTSLRSFFDMELSSTGSTLVVQSAVPTMPVTVATLRPILVNLISNSLKYRAADRALHVRVDCSVESTSFVVDVIDNGSGLGPDPEALFEPGVRGEEADAASGSGLGLSFCRESVGRLAGSIVALDAPVGAHFRILLPMTANAEVGPALGGSAAAGLTAAQLDSVFDLSPTPTLIIDFSARKIVRANQATAELFGRPAAELVGLRAADFLQDQRPVEEIRGDTLKGGSIGDHLRPIRGVLETASGSVAARIDLAAIEGSTLLVAHVSVLGQ